MTTSVYEINAADSVYGQIASCPSDLVARRPFSSAKAGAMGDASLMLVMESPGQVRVYQVSNDPTQLTQNIALIVQKATAAGPTIDPTALK